MEASRRRVRRYGRRFRPAKPSVLLGSNARMPNARTLALAARPAAALLLGLAACDPAYEPPPKPPSSVYIPWQAGPARGRPRRATVAPTSPTAAPSVAPSVELEDVDEQDAGTPD